jgi:murein DD-endopeptidase MepM/ murein hydrolase activator NlpD
MKRRGSAFLLIALLVSGCAMVRPAPAPTPPAVSSPAPAPAPVPPAQSVPEPPPPPPQPQALIVPAKVQQGETAVLRLDQRVQGEVLVRVEGLDEQPKTYELSGQPVAFFGFPANARVGSYPITVTWEGGQWQGSVEVVYKKFTEDRLIVTEEQEQTYYDPRQAEEWARVFALRSKSIPRPLWDGPFAVPLGIPLRITTYFGEIRFVNGKETGRHSGMDFGAPEGTPVLAPARGKVMMAEKLIVTGLTVIIDHGMNLYTTYYHMSGFDVKPGDWVKPGQVIGKVGNTGFSLGAHLHWTATIGNTPVNPWPLTEAAPMGVRAPGPATAD